MPKVPAYHSEDWLNQLARGQAGAAFFRWWFDQNLAPVVAGRGVLFHTGFDPAEVVPVEQKEFLMQGGNLPDFCLVRRQDRPAEKGNVIATFSVNLHKQPYSMHSGALTAGCLGCPAQRPCYEKRSPRLWINVHHQRDAQRYEEAVAAPDFRVVVLLKNPDRIRTAVEEQELHDALLNYLRGGLPAIARTEHAEAFRHLDQLGYTRGRHEPVINWLPTDDPIFGRSDADHWVTKVSTRGSPREVHCISQRSAQDGAALVRAVEALL